MVLVLLMMSVVFVEDLVSLPATVIVTETSSTLLACVVDLVLLTLMLTEYVMTLILV
jgi:hypothetical protein